jgi:sterol desaturase/sphingolipid hydroxylase (fatty acid hydroxylase superfamily)
LFFPGAPAYYTFPLICVASLVASIAVSFATKPTGSEILAAFYKTVRPFGLWKPIAAKAGLPNKDLSSKSESMSLTIVNVLLAMLAITGLYLFPMYLVGRWYIYSAIWLVLAIAAIFTLKYTWYRYLPSPGETRQA